MICRVFMEKLICKKYGRHDTSWNGLQPTEQEEQMIVTELGIQIRRPLPTDRYSAMQEDTRKFEG